MRRRAALAAIVALPAALLARRGARAQSAPAAPPAQARALRADGSLLLGDGRVVRLAGIELGGIGNDSHTQAARAWIEKSVLGRIIALALTVDGEDRHGRLLAQISIDGRWLQGALLEAGLARVRTDPDSRARAQEMLALETQARQRGLGLWADRRLAIVGADQASRAIGRFALVEGRVLKVAELRNRVFLNFGEDWRADFTVLFEDPAARLARRAGLQLGSLQGKRVRVRGLVRSYNGPLIEATHPEQIEMLDG